MERKYYYGNSNYPVCPDLEKPVQYQWRHKILFVTTPDKYYQFLLL